MRVRTISMFIFFNYKVDQDSSHFITNNCFLLSLRHTVPLRPKVVTKYEPWWSGCRGGGRGEGPLLRTIEDVWGVRGGGGVKNAVLVMN